MKKLVSFLFLQVIFILALNAQSVSEFMYKLDNGINVKTERCWNQVWVQQEYSALKPGDQTPLSISTRILGDLTTGSSFKLMKAGKEVKLQGAAPGTYDLKLAYKLSGKPGVLSFVVNNVVIKPNSKTNVGITLYEYQISIAETQVSQKGLSSFDSKLNTYKGTAADPTSSKGIPVFYAKGNHDKPIAPVESASKTTGKIKPGVYDVLINIGISGQVQKIWMENFTMKPDVNYVISTNLNSGIVTYAGTSKDVKNLHLYPAGTAAKQAGNASPIKNLELGQYENATLNNACPPGAYDILVSNGTSYEWKKNMVIKTGSRTVIR